MPDIFRPPNGPGIRYDDGTYEISRDEGNWDPVPVYYEGDIVTGSDGNRYELRDLEGPASPDWRFITQAEFDALTNATTGGVVATASRMLGIE